jgi:hypothetical protein
MFPEDTRAGIPLLHEEAAIARKLHFQNPVEAAEAPLQRLDKGPTIYMGLDLRGVPTSLEGVGATMVVPVGAISLHGMVVVACGLVVAAHLTPLT